MTRTNWAQFTPPPRGRSSFVDEIHTSSEQQCQPISKFLSKNHFQFFLDKFVQVFVARFIEEIFDCRKISQEGAQQLLKDTQTITNDLLEVPVICTGYQTTNVYSKFVLREMGKAVAMLRALSAPDVDADEVTKMFGDGSDPESAARIDRLLALRVDSPSTGIEDLKYKMQNLGFRIQDNAELVKTGIGTRFNERKGQAAENIKTMHQQFKNKMMGFSIPGLK